MTPRTNDTSGVRADPGGFAWTLLLALALVIVIGLIGYLVFKGEAAPVRAPLAAGAPTPDMPGAPVPATPPPIPAPVR